MSTGGKDKQINCSLYTGGMNMKKIRSIALGLVIICLLVLLPRTNVIQVSADGPTTYTLKYSEADGEWKYQPIYPWNDSLGSGWLPTMKSEMKDGDLLVIMASDAGLNLNLTQHLSNLTFENSPNVIVSANGIDDCYVLKGSVAAVNGDVKNAYVYDDARCTFNDNVGYLEIIGTSFPLKMNVTVGGTVEHVKAYDTAENYVRVHFEYYQVAAGKLSIENGDLKTPAAYYSTTPAAVSEPAQPDTTQSEAAASQASSADEYDEVPKTGDTTSYGWLLAVAAVCLISGVCVRCIGRKKYCNE